ncbi:hypothetical protein SIO17_03125 [Pseudoalteromonas piscicida]|uniref:Uncharacterized protein n=1 Tax=Pseudoalteromonas piscicida TaxID=43662 RepID=A0ABN5CAX4_PSEO7|nr:hypothetical protein [Pseudoalteromonas piscicida]ATD05990.1 hypothetical protein PPIS_a0751 [Pseudoalteromonas piscicida]WPU32761.1 hypothetical protein SIO17_03125 [Pseudoalteromonas piscicida]
MDIGIAEVLLLFAAIFIASFLLFKVVLWAKKMPKGAYLFLALMPLIPLFPIPPPVFKNVAKAKQEQRKKAPKSEP